MIHTDKTLNILLLQLSIKQRCPERRHLYRSIHPESAVLFNISISALGRSASVEMLLMFFWWGQAKTPSLSQMHSIFPNCRSGFIGGLKNQVRGFPGGTVVKNPPANAGDVGSSPGLRRSHMPWSKEARAPQLLSLCSRACEPQLLSPCATTTEACTPRACAPQQEKLPQ